MARDVDISVGADTSAFTAGMAEIRTQVKSTVTQIVGELAVPLSIGGLVAYFDTVIEKAHQLHHESERFGLDAERLQLISNAGNALGISMEQIARAMNKAEIAGYKAAEGGHAEVKALALLNLKAQEFNALSADEKILAVADAWNAASDKTAAYNAVAAIFGTRFGTEMIPLLEQGSKKIREVSESMGIMTKSTIETNEHLFEMRNRILNLINVDAARSLAQMFYSAERIGLEFQRWGAFLTGDYGKMNDLRQQIEFVNNEFLKTRASADHPFAIAGDKTFGPTMDEMTGNAPPSSKKPPPSDTEGATTTGDGATGGAAGGGGSGGESLRARSERLQAEGLQRQMSLQEKLNSLKQEQSKIVNDLFAKATAGTQTEEDYYKASIAASDKQKEIDATQAEINKAAQQYLEAQQQVREEIDAEAEAQDRQLQILQLQISGHGDLVDKLRQGWEFEDKIADLTERINQAWSEGDTELADQLTSMRDQVKEEEKLTAELDKQKEIQKQVEDAKNKREQTAGKFNQERSGISQSQQDELAASGKSQSEIASLGGLGTGIASLGSAVTYSDPALLMSTDPSTGVVNQDQLTRNRALAERALLLGQPLPWSTVTLMARQKALQALADHQSTLAREAGRVSNLQEANQLSLIASGRADLVSPDSAMKFPDVMGLLPAGVQRNILAMSPAARDTTWQPAAERIIVELEAIRAELVGAPASNMPPAVLSGSPAGQTQLAAFIRNLLSASK